MKYIIIGIIGVITAAVFYFASNSDQENLTPQVIEEKASPVINVETEGNVQITVVEESSPADNN